MATQGSPSLKVIMVSVEVKLELKCCFTSKEIVGLLGTGAQDVHLDFHTAPELWSKATMNLNLYLSK